MRVGSPLKREIKQAIVTVTGQDRQTYAIVEYTDHGVGITRNGEPIADCYWELDDTDQCMDGCVAALVRLSGVRQLTPAADQTTFPVASQPS